MSEQEQLTREEAIELYYGKDWMTWTPGQIVRLQLFQDRLCIPLVVFHQAVVEEVLDRAVFSHEFANVDRLREEYLALRIPPTFAEILEPIPEDKLLLVKL